MNANHPMHVYELAQTDDDQFVVLKDGEVFWNVKFRFGWRVAYGFCAEDTDGLLYRMESRGVLFWRKLFLFQEQYLVGIFQRKRCIYPFKDLYLDGRMFIYHNKKYVCSLDPIKEKCGKRRYIFRWKLDNAHIARAVATLALISIQNMPGATSGTSLYVGLD